MSEILNYEILAEQLNTKFSLTEANEPFELELIEISEPTVTASQIYFSLFFRGDKKFKLPQGSYQMTHERLGTIILFTVPIALESNGFKYEAVFNLIKEASRKSGD
jgi:hypothetical protein